MFVFLQIPLLYPSAFGVFAHKTCRTEAGVTEIQHQGDTGDPIGLLEKQKCFSFYHTRGAHL